MRDSLILKSKHISDHMFGKYFVMKYEDKEWEDKKLYNAYMGNINPKEYVNTDKTLVAEADKSTWLASKSVYDSTVMTEKEVEAWLKDKPETTVSGSINETR